LIKERKRGRKRDKSLERGDCMFVSLIKKLSSQEAEVSEMSRGSKLNEASSGSWKD
jgi:hypothetical protein